MRRKRDAGKTEAQASSSPLQEVARMGHGGTGRATAQPTKAAGGSGPLAAGRKATRVAGRPNILRPANKSAGVPGGFVAALRGSQGSTMLRKLPEGFARLHEAPHKASGGSATLCEVHRVSSPVMETTLGRPRGRALRP